MSCALALTVPPRRRRGPRGSRRRSRSPPRNRRPAADRPGGRPRVPRARPPPAALAHPRAERKNSSRPPCRSYLLCSQQVVLTASLFVLTASSAAAAPLPQRTLAASSATVDRGRLASLNAALQRRRPRPGRARGSNLSLTSMRWIRVREGGRVDRYAGFRDFVEARGRALTRTAYVLTGEAHLAEDLLQ